jgi:hypothetical protein
MQLLQLHRLEGPRPDLENCDWQFTDLTFESRPVSEIRLGCKLKPCSESELLNEAHHGNHEVYRWFELNLGPAIRWYYVK